MNYRLLIADDSPLYRLRLSQIFAESDRLQIVGLAGDGREAVRLIKERQPDVLVLDLEMPELDGYSVLRWAMHHAPLPVIVCSGMGESESVFRALEAGAVDFITKPELRYAIRSQDFADHLRGKVEAAAEAHAGVSFSPNGSYHAALIQAQKSKRKARASLVGIVGSAGSPAAVTHIFSQLSTDFQMPIIIALHMPQGFTRSFAERLSRHTPFHVSEARDGEAIKDAHVYIAPGGQHTTILRDAAGALHFCVELAGERDFHAPSADRLLSSLGEMCGASSLGVILTGMGEDGLLGARAIRENGGRVVVESRETAIIWGMPRAVSEAGLADSELTPTAIAAALPLLCKE